MEVTECGGCVETSNGETKTRVTRWLGVVAVLVLGAMWVVPVIAELEFFVGQGRNPDVATNLGGDSVVVWEGQDEDGAGIAAQRFDRFGMPLGGELRVNATTEDDQGWPQAIYLPNGNFVVVWESDDTRLPSVTGMCFDAFGMPLGGELRINSSGAARFPEVDVDASGNFVVVWSGSKKGGNGKKYRPRLQRFDRFGMPLGGQLEFGKSKTFPGPLSVAMRDDGEFLVAWVNKKANIKGQVFDRFGMPLGGEFRVNASAAGDQSTPSVAVASDGDYTVVWERDGGNTRTVEVRRVDRFGMPLGGDFAVSQSSSSDPMLPSVASDTYGNTLATWHCRGEDPDYADVLSRRIDLFGMPLGGELRVNAQQDGVHVDSEVSTSGDQFWVVWERAEDGSLPSLILGEALEP